MVVGAAVPVVVAVMVAAAVAFEVGRVPLLAAAVSFVVSGAVWVQLVLRCCLGENPLI